MPLMVGLHYGIAFGLELALLLGFGLFGMHAGQGGLAGGALAVLLVAIAILLWGRFAAPSAATRLTDGSLLVFKIVLFGLGALAFWLAGWREVAIGFAVLAALDLGVATALHRI